MDRLYCIDVACGKHLAYALSRLQVDVTEYMFKLALMQRKYDSVISMIKGRTRAEAARAPMPN